MKAAPFAYHAPDALDRALELLAEAGPDARPLAGGQSLLPAMATRARTPSTLVDLNRISALDAIAVENGELVLGAMVRHRRLERDALVAEHCPLLAEAVGLIAAPAVRNRGTVGGSLAQGDPWAEIPAVAAALRGTVTISGARGSRVVPAADARDALESGELIVELRLPVAAPGSGGAYAEISRRFNGTAILGVAAQVRRRDGALTDARLALANAGPAPLALEHVERLIEGEAPSEELYARAADAAREGLEPPDDLHASGAYRRHVAGVLVARALRSAAARAREAGS